MVNIPWTIYKDNKNIQYSDQWELILYNSVEQMEAYDPTSMSSRLKSMGVGGISSFLKSSIAFPQSRIKKLIFPTPFPEFKIKDLPNKVNVYNEAIFDTRDVSITITEDTDFSVFNYFNDWYKEIYSKQNRQFMPKAETVYRYASVVFRKKGHLIEAPSMRFNLHKLKLVSFDKNIDLDYEPGTPIEFTINMKVEDVTFESF